MWQNAEAYKKALLKFSRDFEKSADNIMNSIENGDKETAYHIARALKGVAGNLSVTDVFRTAVKLHDEIRQKPPEELIPDIKSLATALKILLSIPSENGREIILLF